MKTTHTYLIIGLLSFLLYANTITHEYAWDDILVITENKTTTKGVGGLKEVWTEYSYLAGRDIYRPVPQSIHALEWEFFPNNPFIGHLTSIFLYVFLVVSFLFGLKTFFPNLNNWLIFFIGLMFSLLPVHVEAVANIKSIDELLSASFSIWTLILLKKISLKNILLAILFFSLALLSKISSITILPIAIVVILISLNLDLSNYFTQIKQKLDYSLIIAIGLFLLTAYFHKVGSSIVLKSYLLFFTLFFTLFIKNRTLKFSFFILATIPLSIFGKWEYSLIALIILFSQDINNSNFNKKLWIGIYLIFSTITITLDFNSYFLSFVLAVFLLIYYYYVKVNANSKILYTLYFLLLATTISSLYEIQDLGFKFPYILIVIILFFTKNQKFSNFKKHLLLLLFIPILEMSFNFIEYDNIFYNLNTIIDINTEREIDEITPYHNVLVVTESISQKAATICRIQLIYLQKLIFPTQLIHQYGTRQIEFASWKDWDVYFSILLHILLIYLAYYFYKYKHYIAMWGITWYFLTISIYTNIIRLLPDTLAERFLLLPSIGFCIAFIAGLSFFLNKAIQNENKTNRIMAILLAPLFIYYAFKTIDRNQDWENNYTLAVNTLPFAENNATINAQYAAEIDNLIKNNSINNIDSAKILVLKHYQKAIEIFPDFYGPQSDLAAFHIKNKDPNSAFPHLLKASELKPEVWSHHYYLGLIFYERNKYENAIKHFTEVQENTTLLKNPFNYPELLDAFEYEARCLRSLGKDSIAYFKLEKGIEIFNQKSTYILLANLYRTTGKADKAIDVFERLLLLYPEDQELINTIQFLKEGKIY